jgi:hypothetical protein
MRTTVELPDTLLREVKAVAARRGESLKAFLRRAVEGELRRASDRAPRRISFPLLDSQQPGSINPSNDEIDQMLA